MYPSLISVHGVWYESWLRCKCMRGMEELIDKAQLIAAPMMTHTKLYYLWAFCFFERWVCFNRVLLVFPHFFLKQPLQSWQGRYARVGCLLDNTLEVKINVCQTKWNVRLQLIHDRWGLGWYFLRWMKTGTQAALCAVVRQGRMRTALKDTGSDFSDCFSLLINSRESHSEIRRGCMWKFRMTAQQIKL